MRKNDADEDKSACNETDNVFVGHKEIGGDKGEREYVFLLPCKWTFYNFLFCFNKLGDFENKPGSCFRQLPGL